MKTYVYFTEFDGAHKREGEYTDPQQVPRTPSFDNSLYNALCMVEEEPNIFLLEWTTDDDVTHILRRKDDKETD